MSLIGPRPEIPKFVDLNDACWREVLAITPGLFDEATLRMRDEAKRMVAAEDWSACYRLNILPEKLDWSLQGHRQRSLGRDTLLVGRLAYQVAVDCVRLVRDCAP
jgi:lipopolysaccharide/colanic/teichoic acid biosynthesis glycosyltransferase